MIGLRYGKNIWIQVGKLTLSALRLWGALWDHTGASSALDEDGILGSCRSPEENNLLILSCCFQDFQSSPFTKLQGNKSNKRWEQIQSFAMSKYFDNSNLCVVCLEKLLQNYLHHLRNKSEAHKAKWSRADRSVDHLGITDAFVLK